MARLATQGKNERFHQTLFRYLDNQPIAATLAEMQEQVDAFDVIYNTQRPQPRTAQTPHPTGRMGRHPIAKPPRTRLAAERPTTHAPAAGAPVAPLPFENMTTRRVKSSGAIEIRDVTYRIARELAGLTIYIATAETDVKFYDMPGDLLLERPGPASGTKHVSNGRPRGASAKRPENIPEMLRHNTGLPQGEYHRTVRRDGRISIRGIVYGIGKDFAGLSVHVIAGADTCAFWDARTGELIAEHPIPEPGTTHVGFVRYNRRTPTFEPDPEPSPMGLSVKRCAGPGGFQ